MKAGCEAETSAFCFCSICGSPRMLGLQKPEERLPFWNFLWVEQEPMVDHLEGWDREGGRETKREEIWGYS